MYSIKQVIQGGVKGSLKYTGTEICFGPVVSKGKNPILQGQRHWEVLFPI